MTTQRYSLIISCALAGYYLTFKFIYTCTRFRMFIHKYHVVEKRKSKCEAVYKSDANAGGN